MTAGIGIVMLLHIALGWAEQVARHWAAAGCPVVIHVDTGVSKQTYDGFRKTLSDIPQLLFSKRYRCE